MVLNQVGVKIEIGKEFYTVKVELLLAALKHVTWPKNSLDFYLYPNPVYPQ
jgi:hypothetical protein